MQGIFVETERKRLNEQRQKGRSLILFALVIQWQLSLDCMISV